MSKVCCEGFEVCLQSEILILLSACQQLVTQFHFVVILITLLSVCQQLVTQCNFKVEDNSVVHIVTFASNLTHEICLSYITHEVSHEESVINHNRSVNFRSA